MMMVATGSRWRQRPGQGGRFLARLAEQAEAGPQGDREQGAFEDALDEHSMF